MSTSSRDAIRDAVLALCERFDDAYWLEHDRSGDYPQAFKDAMAEGGWLGIAMPREHGGSGLGVSEAAVMMRAVAESGAGMSGASCVHHYVWGLAPVVKFGTPSSRRACCRP
jgi:acyl-CoA dehydrogenase